MKINYFIYVIQHNFGILPKWERELIENDVHLKTFKRWMVKSCLLYTSPSPRDS